MTISRSGRSGRSASPVTVLAGILVFAGAFGLLRGRGGEPGGAVACDPADTGCAPVESSAALTAQPPTSPPLSAANACRNVGYLCADLANTDRIRLQRWKSSS